MDKRHLLKHALQTPGIRPALALAAVAAVLMAAVTSEARVFLRWPAAANLARWVAGRGGDLAYQTDLVVNGQTAHISVFGLPAANRAWGNSIKTVSYEADNVFTSLTGLTLSGTPLLLQYQRRQTAKPANRTPDVLPRFPQSTPAFHAFDKNTDMDISISRSQASPAHVREFYQTTMPAQGWHMPLTSRTAPAAGMMVFIREQEVACIGIEQRQHPPETRITLLHKKMKIRP